MLNTGQQTSGMSNIDVRRRKNMRIVLGLLASAAFINYIDRGNLSMAAPLLKTELTISTSQRGMLLSSFFWTYTVLEFFSGWLVDCFGGAVVLALGYLIWSLATTATGFAR